MKLLIIIIGLLTTLLASVSIAETAQVMASTANPTVGEQVKWQVVSGGWTQVSSAGYKVNGTVVQTATTPVTSAGYKTSQGFWYGGVCCFKDGDANHNGSVNVVDITYLVNYLFKGGPIYSCKDEADVNDNGSANVVDITYLVNYLFKGGPITTCP